MFITLIFTVFTIYRKKLTAVAPVLAATYRCPRPARRPTPEALPGLPRDARPTGDQPQSMRNGYKIDVYHRYMINI